MKAIKETNLNLPGLKRKYTGKVRDVYFLENDRMVMVASDRISAFDVVLPEGIPGKGQILNAIAEKNLRATEDIVPNWLENVPHPNVSVGQTCEPVMVEMVIRGYLAGHAWREYRDGKRELCGVPMPEGMAQNDKFPQPIITPATKAEEGHDEDISREDILAKGIVPEGVYVQMEDFTRKLFQRGTELAAKQGLILVDTKYEFGLIDGKVILMDEIHTPDSSRYFYADTYAELQEKGEPQRQLSKEFVREWLMENGFQGKDGQQVPEMTPEVVKMISGRYAELYKQLMGEDFKVSDAVSDAEIETMVLAAL